MRFTFTFNDRKAVEIKFDFSKLAPEQKLLSPVAKVGISYLAREIARNVAFSGYYSSLYKSGAPLVFTVTSARRSPEHNAKVGGVKSSSHIKGDAIDVRCVNSVLRRLLIESAVDASTPRIGVAKDYIHFDWDFEKIACMWVY